MFTAPLRSFSACVCAERMQLQRQLDFPTDGNLNTRPSVSVMSQRDPKHSAATFFLFLKKKKSLPFGQPQTTTLYGTSGNMAKEEATIRGFHFIKSTHLGTRWRNRLGRQVLTPGVLGSISTEDEPLTTTSKHYLIP